MIFEGFGKIKKQIEVTAAAGLTLGAAVAAEAPEVNAASMQQPGVVIEHHEEIGTQSIKKFAETYQSAFPHLRLGLLHLKRAPQEAGDAQIRGFVKYEVFCTDDAGAESSAGYIVLGPIDLASGGQPNFDAKVLSALHEHSSLDTHYLQDMTKGPLQYSGAEVFQHTVLKFDPNAHVLNQKKSDAFGDHVEIQVLYDFNKTAEHDAAVSVSFAQVSGSSDIVMKVAFADGKSAEVTITHVDGMSRFYKIK